MRTFGRVLFTLLIVGAIGALGYGIWNAGYQQGLAETLETTADVVVATPFAGYYGFGVFGVFFKVFFALLLFGLLFKVLFGRRHWRRYAEGHGSGQFRSPMEDRMKRWHDEAHGEGRDPTGS